MIKKTIKILLCIFIMMFIGVEIKQTIYAEEPTVETTEEESVEEETSEESSEEDTTEEDPTEEDPTEEDPTEEEPTEEEPTEKEPIRILFVGNSFTRSGGTDMGVMLKKVAESQGEKVEADVLVNPGFYLEYYTNSKISKFEYHYQLVNLLRDNEYDYVVLQESSFGCIEDTEKMKESIEKIKGYIQYYQADAEILLYLTHSYSDGSVLEIGGEEKTLSIKERLKYIQASHVYVGKETNIKVVPAGIAFYRCYLALPDVSWYKSDNKHPDVATFFVMACTFYKEIYGVQPSFENVFIEGVGLTDEEQKLIDDIANNSFVFDKSYRVLGVDESYTLEYDFADGVPENIKWSSLDKNVASVNNGVIIANAEGRTAIIGTTDSGAQAVCIVVVENADVKKKGITFLNSKYVLEIGEQFKSIPKVSVAYKDDKLKWSVSNNKLAKISSDGVVTAVAPGRAKVTLRNLSNGKSASYYVYIRNKAPINLQADNVTKGVGAKASMYIQLKWTKSSDATHYVVYRSTKANNGYKKIAVTDKNKYTDKTVERNKTYYYKVTAYKNFVMCESDKSTKVKSIALAPSKIEVVKARKNDIKIQWKKNNNATGYIIYRATGKAKAYKKIAVIDDKNKTVYKDKKLKANNTYYYVIKVYKKIGDKTYYSNRLGATKAKTIKVNKKKK